jgi:hypothetical protein
MDGDYGGISGERHGRAGEGKRERGERIGKRERWRQEILSPRRSFSGGGHLLGRSMAGAAPTQLLAAQEEDGGDRRWAGPLWATSGKGGGRELGWH